MTLAALASCHAPAAAALLCSHSSSPEATTPEVAPAAAPALMAALAMLHDHALPQVCDGEGGVIMGNRGGVMGKGGGGGHFGGNGGRGLWDLLPL